MHRRLKMIFADKLIQLRKKAGWSQEELAQQINVTRQSVSKWEGAQAVPDLEKMLRLSQLFGVSTDYLIKDEMEQDEGTVSYIDDCEPRHVSMEEANTFLHIKAKTAKTIAYGVFLCVISPVALFIMGAISDESVALLGEDAASGIGMIILFMLVGIAVAMFVSSGSKTAPFEYLEKEVFETAYGVTGMVKERKEQYKNLYRKNNIAGAFLCITAMVPLFVGTIIDSDNDLLLVIMFSFAFVLAGLGVICFVRTGIIWASFEKLLQEGDYTKRNKEKPSYASAIYTAYWMVATAIYLGYSLATENWMQSWIIWVVAGVLFPAVVAITNVLDKR